MHISALDPVVIFWLCTTFGPPIPLQGILLPNHSLHWHNKSFLSIGKTPRHHKNGNGGLRLHTDRGHERNRNSNNKNCLTDLQQQATCHFWIIASTFMYKQWDLQKVNRSYVKKYDNQPRGKDIMNPKNGSWAFKQKQTNKTIMGLTKTQQYTINN